MNEWTPPPDWQRISTIDLHAAGEPLRVIVGGLDPIPGTTIVDKRRFARERLDGLRRALMFEPRGHADMYGAIVTEPVTVDGDLGVLFMHNEGWSTMCGHGIIALVTLLMETGVGPSTIPSSPFPLPAGARVLRIDTPAGRVTARAEMDGRRVARAAFENVPSFAYALDREVAVPGLGRVRYDIGFGGAFYAYVDAGKLGLDLSARDVRALIESGMAIKRAVMATTDIRHPFEPELSFLYGTIFGGPPADATHQARNVCIFAEGEVDRSPTGTGVSGRMAIEHARGRLLPGQPFTIASILGTTFTGRVVRETRYAEHAAIIPEVSGQAWITGRHEFLIAPDDALCDGFMLR
jgi:trans-L-3-hydroxyproline dehydratase